MIDKFGSVNWERSIIINEPINEGLVRKITPDILLLRQKSKDAITIGIDSPGGSLASLETLISLLTGPTQNGDVGEIITVAINRAYSAAANFLAFGSYAVALKHSEILFHDVRFGGIEDVTPQKARETAKQLQKANDHFALKLANQIIRRIIWVYIDKQDQFEKAAEVYPEEHKRYSKIVDTFTGTLDGDSKPRKSIDLASFVTYLFASLSVENDDLVNNVMGKLETWVYRTKSSQLISSYRKKGARNPGLLDGAKYLHKQIHGTEHEKRFDKSEEEFKLYLSLLVEQIPGQTPDIDLPFSILLDQAMRDYNLIQSMNDNEHLDAAAKLLLTHESIFMQHPSGKKFAELTDKQRIKVMNDFFPYARLFWHFCVLLCRELFEGDHILKPQDAQLLGLIDEIAGGGLIESRREFSVKQKLGSEK